VAGPIAKLGLTFPKDEREWKQITVGRSSKHTTVIHFPRQARDGDRHVIAWEFKTADYDIAFGVLHSHDAHVNSERADNSLVAVDRVNSHEMPICGRWELKAEEHGYFHLVWDNSSSYLRSKSLQYILSIEGEHVFV
jgi:hypothetical protein